MNLEKLLYTLGVAFSTVFLMSLTLVLTNTLNVWLIVIVSLPAAIVSFAVLKIVKNKEKKR